MEEYDIPESLILEEKASFDDTKGWPVLKVVKVRSCVRWDVALPVSLSLSESLSLFLTRTFPTEWLVTKSSHCVQPRSPPTVVDIASDQKRLDLGATLRGLHPFTLH